MNRSGPRPAQRRVLPADQRLDADGPLVAEAHQRLVLDVELLAVHRGRQCGRQREPDDLVGVALRVVDAPAALAVGLGPVLGDVGVADQISGRGAGDGPLHDADAGRDGELVAADAYRRHQCLQHGLGDGDDVVRARRALGEHHELVTAHPGDQPARARDGLVEAPGDGHQQPVADGVAEAVVDHLEPVQVQVAHADPGPAGVVPLLGEHRAEPFQEQRAVGQAGQRVVGGLVAQALGQRVPLGDVLHHGDGEQRPPRVVADQGARDVCPHPAAIGPAQPLLHPVVVQFAAYDAFERVPQAVAVVLGVHVVADVGRQRLRPGGAGHPLQRRVGLDDAAGHVGDADADGRVGEHGAELGLAGP